MSFRGNLLRAGIDSDGKIVTVYRNDGRLDVLTSGSKLTGTIRSANFTHTQNAAGAGIFETFRASLASEYRTGSWANAIVGRIDYGDTGDSAGGMAAAICGEMNIAAKDMHNLGGAYYCFDAEMNVPDGCTLMTSTTTRPVAFLKFGAWGDGVGEFDDKGFLFHTDGISAGAGHLLSENSRTLRVNIGGTAKYIYLSDTEDDLGAMYADSINVVGDLPATHGVSLDMDVPMLTLGNIHVSGVHVDLTQTSAVAGTGTAEGRLYGVRSIVRQEMDITNVFGVHGMVVATPAASSNVNDFVGVYGGIEAKGTFANSNSGLSSWAALKGDIWNTCTGSWDSQVYTLMLSYGSSVNYSGETAFMHAYNHGDTYMDYGLHLIQNSTAQAVAAMILIDPATSTTITTGIDIDGSGTITTGIDIGSATTGIALTGTCTNGIDLTDMTLTSAKDNAFISVGSVETRKEITVTDNLYALQVACDSIANPSSSDSAIYAAYLSIDATTADQTNSRVGGLMAHAHIYKDVAAAYGVQGHATVKDSMSTVGGAHLIGVSGKFTVDSSKTMAVGNGYGVLGVVGGAGNVTDNCYAIAGHVESGVTAANGIAWLYSYSNVATAILISSTATITTGIDVGDDCTTGIDIGTSATGLAMSGAYTTVGIDFALTVSTQAGDGNACLIRGGYAASGGHTAPNAPIVFATANQHAVQMYLHSSVGKFTGVEINAYTSAAGSGDNPCVAGEFTSRSLSAAAGVQTLIGVLAQAQTYGSTHYGPATGQKLIGLFARYNLAADVAGKAGSAYAIYCDLNGQVASAEGDYGIYVRNNGIQGVKPHAMEFSGGFANVFSFGPVQNVNYGDAWKLTGTCGTENGWVRVRMCTDSGGATWGTKYIQLWDVAG